jgi:dTMP kinase
MLMPGVLIAFEGLDQSGKATQAMHLRKSLEASNLRVETQDFPDYTTAIGAEIARTLREDTNRAPDVTQLLFIANRYEHRVMIEDWIRQGAVVLCDRYQASSVAYGEAHGVDPVWLYDVQRFLPQPALTILLDIDPDTAVVRKQEDRDRYERDLALLTRVRTSYLKQAEQFGWAVLDGRQDPVSVRDAIVRVVRSRLGLL